jgi:hypothetical protein
MNYYAGLKSRIFITYHLPFAFGKGTPPSRRRRISPKIPLLLEGGVARSDGVVGI